jgi:hypothetical protein
MNIRKAIIFVISLAIFGWVLLYIFEYFNERADEGMTFDQLPPLAPIVQEGRTIFDEPAVSVVEAPSGVGPTEPKSWPAVPFVSQAPTGEWGKSEFQNGCEEASVLMVHAWRTGKAYTKETAKQELVLMARYQEKQIGQGIDTDVTDTAKTLLAGYFDITEYQLVYDFTLDDLRQATGTGLVIVPTNGQALKNPNFTRPGPLQHMLVITGYDRVAEEFITNDPGTRKGEGYRYPEAMLFAAIREYPTGKHLPIETDRKAMIVIPSKPNY